MIITMFRPVRDGRNNDASSVCRSDEPMAHNQVAFIFLPVTGLSPVDAVEPLRRCAPAPLCFAPSYQNKKPLPFLEEALYRNFIVS